MSRRTGGAYLVPPKTYVANPPTGKVFTQPYGFGMVVFVEHQHPYSSELYAHLNRKENHEHRWLIHYVNKKGKPRLADLHMKATAWANLKAEAESMDYSIENYLKILATGHRDEIIDNGIDLTLLDALLGGAE